MVDKEEKKLAEEVDKDAQPIQKDEEKKTEEKQKEVSKPAVAKFEESTKTKKSESKETTLEREYVIPLRKEILKAPRYRRAKKAIKAIRDFLVRHMQIRDGDTNKIKIDIHLNNEVWFRGIKKPVSKIRVRAVKRGGIVYVELAELPEVISYKKAREEKRKQAATKVKETKKAVQKETEPKAEDGVDTKTEEKEDEKSKANLDEKVQKATVRAQQHTTKGTHTKKTMPRRKALQK